MSKYLGETIVDIPTHLEYKHYTGSDWAMEFISGYGQIDGSHHKTWVLDQVARCLHGTPIILKRATWDDGSEEYRFKTGKPSVKYKEWVASQRGAQNSDGEYEYDYDEGVCP